MRTLKELEDFEKRMVNEYATLMEKIDALQYFLISESTEATRRLMPYIETTTMEQQLQYMNSYADALRRRIVMRGIKLGTWCPSCEGGVAESK